MIKISKELKAGIAALLIIILFIWGVNFLKGRNLFNGSMDSYYTTYHNINGLSMSSAVTMNGFTVGRVVDITFNDNPSKPGELIVEFTLEEDVHFSKKSIAKIYSGGLMGGKSLAIIPSYEGEVAEPGDYLKGEIESDIFSSISDKLNPLQAKVESTIVNIDSVALGLKKLLDKKSIEDLKQSIARINQILTNLEGTTKTVDVTIKKNEENLDATIKSMHKTTQNLERFSDSLAQVKILSISKSLNNTVASLDSITSGIQSGKGTLGKLTKDEKLYDNLKNASKELEELLRDVKEHPKRFVHFSLFGKKNKSYKEIK